MSSPALVLPCFSFFWRNPIMQWVCCEFIFQFLFLSWYFPWFDVRLHTFQKFTIFGEIFALTVEMYWHLTKNDETFSLIVTLYCMYHREELECFHPQTLNLHTLHLQHTHWNMCCVSHMWRLCVGGYDFKNEQSPGFSQFISRARGQR